MPLLSLRPQEIPVADKRSQYMFEPSDDKPFVATRAAVDTFGTEPIIAGLRELQGKARQEDGLGYLQVFDVEGYDEALWFIEDGPGGAITALLPSDY